MGLNQYQIVRLANGEFSVRSMAHEETFHPVIGPQAEAEALYVRQLELPDRIANSPEEFVIWDVGLGAAANPVTLLKGVSSAARGIKLVSFDCTTEPLQFALEHTEQLQYLRGFEKHLGELVEQGFVQFTLSGAEVRWEFHGGDFPTLLRSEAMRGIAPPHAIFYDAFSPAKNPTMWTLAVFSDLFKALSPLRPCLMPTYSRSTLLRVTLLVAGFYVGVGHATGEKEETTIAANQLHLLDEPLDRKWLLRVRRSTSAEPLHHPVYTRAPLSQRSWELLQAHPQFA